MKIIRKITLLLLVALLSLSQLMAQQGHVTKNLDVTSFSSVAISSCFSVTFEKSDKFSVTLTVPERIDNSLIAKVQRGTLILGIKNVFKEGLHLSENEVLKAHITAPAFSSIKLSGASNIKFIGKFNASEVSIDLSGASDLDDLNIKSGKISISLSGASNVRSMNAVANQFECDLSGGADCNITL